MKRLILPLIILCIAAVAPAKAQRVSTEMQVNNQYREQIVQYIQQDVQKRQKQMNHQAQQILINLPNDQKLYDETFVNIKGEIVERTREDGTPEMNYLFQIDYTCSHIEAIHDGYPLGSYICNSSNSSRALADLTKTMVEGPLKDIFTPGSDITVTIHASTDATDISHIDYLGEYGDFRYCPAIYNDESVRISVSQEEGINTNAQLAYMRAQSVKAYLEQHMPLLAKTNNDYHFVTRSFADTGSNFRRSSITLEVHGAFDKKAAEMEERLRQDEFVDFNIPVCEPNSNNNTFVIIVANEDYKTLPNVPFALNDGAILQQYCIKTLGIPQRHVKFLKNADAATIRREGIEWIKDITIAVKGDANILLYFAGHGISGADSRPYLIPNNVDYSKIKSFKGRYFGSEEIELSSRDAKRLLPQCIAVDTLANWFNRVNYKNLTFIIDASLNGVQRNGQSMFTLPGVGGKKKGRGMRLRNNIVVFSAAATDKTAYSFDDQHHGFFTYYLLKELKRTKGTIGFEELYNNIEQQLSYESSLQGKLQQPTVLAGGKVKDSWQGNTLR